MGTFPFWHSYNNAWGLTLAALMTPSPSTRYPPETRSILTKYLPQEPFLKGKGVIRVVRPPHIVIGVPKRKSTKKCL